MYTVYILYSMVADRYYTGYTSLEVSQRLDKHLSNHKGFTARYKDWEVVFQMDFSDKQAAILMERKIKKRGAKRYLKDIASR